MKNTEIYFEKVRQLPLAMSFAKVESLVQIKGVTKPPIKNAWWNLNSILMTTLFTISTIAFFWITSSNEAENELIMLKSQEIKNQLGLDSTNSREEEKINSFEINSIRLEEKVEKLEKITNEVGLMLKSSLVEDSDIINAVAEVNVLENVINKEIAYTDSTFNANSGKRPDIQKVDLKLMNKERLNDSIKSELEGIVEGKTKTISKEFLVDGIEWLKVSNKLGNIKIRNWDEPKISFVATVTMKGKDDDVQKGLEDFDIHFNKNGNKIEVNHNWTGEINSWCIGFCWPPARNKIKTKNGEKIKIEKVEVSYVLTIPKKMNLDLTNKYGDVFIQDIEGKLIADLFQGNLKAGNIKGDLTLVEKYGKASISSFENGEITIFQGETNLGTSHTVKLKANYSKVRLVKTKSLELIAFQSNIKALDKIEKVSGSLKYGDLDLKQPTEVVDLKMFQANLFADNIVKLKLNSSYSKAEAVYVESCVLENSFQNKFNLRKIKDLEGKAKYSTFKLGVISNSIELDVFQGRVEVEQIGSTFKKVGLLTKYTSLDINFDIASKFNIETKTEYSSLKLPPEIEKTNVLKQNNRSDIKGTYNTSLGTEASEVQINSFQGDLNISIGNYKTSKVNNTPKYKQVFMITPTTSQGQKDSLVEVLFAQKIALDIQNIKYDNEKKIEEIEGTIKKGWQSGYFSITEEDEFHSLAFMFKPGFGIEINGN